MAEPSDNIKLGVVVEADKAAAKKAGKDIKDGVQAGMGGATSSDPTGSVAGKKIINQQKKTQSTLLKNFKAFQTQFSNIGQKLGKVAGYAAASAAVYGLVRAVTESIRVVVEYEKVFATLRAKTGLTAKHFNEVAQSVMDVATATQFSVEAIGAAATELGKLGFAANEIVKVLPNVAIMASATGESLDTVAKSMGSVLRTFGLDADSSGSIGDRMVASFRSSALDLKKFSTAFSYVGDVAKTTGTSFDELNSAFQVLADRGVTASRMGTGLRQVFIKLNESGMSLDDILKGLKERNISFADSVALVGARGAAQLQILSENYDEFAENVTEANDAMGAAFEASAIQQDTIAARWDAAFVRLKSVIAGVTEASDDFRKNIGLGFWASVVEFFAGGIPFAEGGIEAQYKRLAQIYIYQNEEFVKKWKEYQKANPGATSEQIMIGLGIYDSTSQEANALTFAAQGVIDELDVKAVADAAAKKYEELQREIRNGLSKARLKGGVAGGNAYLDEQATRVGGETNNTWGKEVQWILGLKANEDAPSYWESQRKLFDAYGTNVDRIMSGVSGVRKDLSDENERSVRENLAARKKIKDEVCRELPYNEALLLGYDCKKADDKDTKFAKYVPDPELKTGMENAVNSLKSKIAGTDDIQEQKGFYQGILEVKKNYYKGDIQAANEYISGMNAVLKKGGLSDTEIVQIRKNITGAEGSALKSVTGMTGAQTDYDKKDFSHKQKAFKKDQLLYKQHLINMKTLANEYGQALTPEDRAKAVTAQLADIDTYYNGLEKSTKEYWAEQKAAYKAQGGELGQAGYNMAVVDEKIALGNIAGSRKNEKSAVKDRESMTAEELKQDNLKIAQFTVDSLAQIYDIRKAHTDRMIEEAQRQADAESEAINKQFEEQATIRESALQSGIISMEDATEAEIAAEKQKQEKLNAIAKKQFELEKQARIENLIIDGLVGAAQATIGALAAGPAGWYMAAIAGGIALAASAQAVSAEQKRQYVPRIFAEGGMVNGPSHAAGGVPFSVRGHGGYEMEGGEYIVNKKAVSDNFALLEAINGRTKNQKHFATGGYIPEVTNTGGADFNSALLEALNKPVRAYVTDQDLATANSERTALATKTSY